MSEIKQRYYITPSSLASYFGCGFNSPEEQFAIDSGEEAAVFDDESQRRMKLGTLLEDAVIQYFEEEVFKTPITDRNEEIKIGYGGKIKYAIDGKLMLDKPTGFENKVSNSESYKFTEHKGYHIQVQAYMLCEDLEQFVLAGLYKGKPVHKMIYRDEDMINDIKRMTEFVVDALQGLVDFYEDFPVDLLEKHGKTKLYEPITDLSKATVEYLHELAELNAQKSELEKKIKELKARHEDDFELSEGVYEDDKVSVRVSKWIKKGGFSVDEFMNANPHFDLTPYYEEDKEMSRTVIKLK